MGPEKSNGVANFGNSEPVRSGTATLRRLGRRGLGSVRRREVLSVVATLEMKAGADGVQLVSREVLAWAQRRAGGKFPPKAWSGQEFEHLGAGRTVLGLNLEDDGESTWAFRADDPDKNVPGRTWTTEVTVWWPENGLPQLAVHQAASSAEPEMRLAPHVPGLVRQLAVRYDLRAGGLRVQTQPIRIASDDDVRILIDLLRDQERRLPVIVATGDDRGSDPARPLLDVESLAAATLGLALIVVVPAAQTFVLSDVFGRVRSVFHGGARVYVPSFDESADPSKHRLFLGDVVAHDPRKTEYELRRIVARESILRTTRGHDSLTFSAVRSAVARRKQELAHRASEAEELVAAKSRIEALERELTDANDYVEQFCELATQEEERAKQAESIQYGLRARIGSLQSVIARQGFDPDAGIELPQDWNAFADWCDEDLAGRLVLASQARRGIKKARFEDMELVSRCLLHLASEIRDRRMSGGGSLANTPILSGIENSPCGNDSFVFSWQGRELSADWHIKTGGNTRDPRRCLRIYYCFDEESEQIVVADMPAHRKTGAS